MKILVTGADGQLGMSFREVAEGSGHEFLFTSSVPSEGTMKLDITDAEEVSRVVAAEGTDVIINCAGYTDVAKAEQEPDKALKVNAEAVGYLAEAARSAGALLVHISTDYVFGGRSGVPYAEDAQPAPLSAYGRSKLAGETAVLASGCRHLIIRSAWLYSVYGNNFVKTIYEKTASQPVIKVVSDQIGTPTYAGDLVEFIMSLLEDDIEIKDGIYNYTNEGVCSWYDLAWEVCRLSGHLCDVLPCRTADYPTGVERPHFSVLDKTKVRETFGIGIPHWSDSLRFCLSKFE